MAKIKFDVSGVEPGRDFDTPLPKGVYKMRVNEIEDTTSGADGRPMFKVELEVPKGEWAGRRVWDYIKYEDETSQWKLRQLLEALGVIRNGKESGEFDPQKFIGDIIVVKVKHETSEEYGTQAKVASMSALPEAEAEEEAEEEQETTEPEASGEDEGLTAAEIREMDLDELKDLIKDEEVEGIRITKKSKAESVQDKLIEYWELPEETEEAETEGEGEEASYSDMSAAELKAECEERGLKATGPKKALISRLEKDDASGGGDGDAEPF